MIMYTRHRYESCIPNHITIIAFTLTYLRTWQAKGTKRKKAGQSPTDEVVPKKRKGGKGRPSPTEEEVPKRKKGKQSPTPSKVMYDVHDSCLIC